MYRFTDQWPVVASNVEFVPQSDPRERHRIAYAQNVLGIVRKGENFWRRHGRGWWLAPLALIVGGSAAVACGVGLLALVPLQLLWWAVNRRVVRNVFLVAMVLFIVTLETGLHCFALGWTSDICRL